MLGSGLRQQCRLFWCLQGSNVELGLIAMGMICLVWPVAGTLALQPHSWATATVGSVYFWGTLALWGCLLGGWWVSWEG